MTNKPDLNLAETGAGAPSSLKTKTSSTTSSPSKTTENPLLAAISEVTIPVLATTFKLTPAANPSETLRCHLEGRIRRPTPGRDRLPVHDRRDCGSQRDTRNLDYSAIY